MQVGRLLHKPLVVNKKVTSLLVWLFYSFIFFILKHNLLIYEQNAPKEMRSVYKIKKTNWKKLLLLGKVWSLHSMQYQNPMNQIRVRFGKCTYVSLLNVNPPFVKSLKFKGFDMISASYCWNHLADIVTRQGYCKTVWQAWENKLDGCSDELSQLAWLELDSESVKLCLVVFGFQCFKISASSIKSLIHTDLYSKLHCEFWTYQNYTGSSWLMHGSTRLNVFSSGLTRLS